MILPDDHNFSAGCLPFFADKLQGVKPGRILTDVERLLLFIAKTEVVEEVSVRSEQPDTIQFTGRLFNGDEITGWNRLHFDVLERVVVNPPPQRVALPILF